MDLAFDEDGAGAAAIGWPEARQILADGARRHVRTAAGQTVAVEWLRFVDADGREIRIPDSAVLVAGVRRVATAQTGFEDGSAVQTGFESSAATSARLDTPSLENELDR